MSNILSNNWENHFKEHPSNEANNKIMDELFEIFNLTTPSVYLVSAIEEQETVFIAQAPITNHILFLHHFQKIGGTRTSPTTKHFTLSGYGPLTYPTQVTAKSLFTKSDHQVPSWVAFTSITDSTSVTSLTTPLNVTSCKYHHCIPIPPFLVTSLMDTGGASSSELISTAILRIKSYDAKHVVDPDHIHADTHYQLILGLLYLAHQNQLSTFATVPLIDP